MGKPNDRPAGRNSQAAPPFDTGPVPKPTTPKQAVISSIFDDNSPITEVPRMPATVTPTQPQVSARPPATQPLFQPMFIQPQPTAAPNMLSAMPGNMSTWNMEQVRNPSYLSYTHCPGRVWLTASWVERTQGYNVQNPAKIHPFRSC